MTVHSSNPRCPHEAIAELNRRRRRRGGSSSDIMDSWWAYCAEHLYGRWVEDGRVMRWRLVPNDE